MPTDYIYKALVTAARNDGSSNLINYTQKGFAVFFAASQSILSGGTATSETNASTAAAVPPIAHSFELAYEASAAATSGPVFGRLRHVSGTNFFTFSVSTASSGGETQFEAGVIRFPYVANVAYLWNSSFASRALGLEVLGFRLPGGGE